VFVSSFSLSKCLPRFLSLSILQACVALVPHCHLILYRESHVQYHCGIVDSRTTDVRPFLSCRRSIAVMRMPPSERVPIGYRYPVPYRHTNERAASAVPRRTHHILYKRVDTSNTFQNGVIVWVTNGTGQEILDQKKREKKKTKTNFFVGSVSFCLFNDCYDCVGFLWWLRSCSSSFFFFVFLRTQSTSYKRESRERTRKSWEPKVQSNMLRHILTQRTGTTSSRWMAVAAVTAGFSLQNEDEWCSYFQAKKAYCCGLVGVIGSDTYSSRCVEHESFGSLSLSLTHSLSFFVCDRFIHSLIHSFIHSFIRSFIHSCIHSFLLTLLLVVTFY
jgi:hypothetical protein